MLVTSTTIDLGYLRNPSATTSPAFSGGTATRTMRGSVTKEVVATRSMARAAFCDETSSKETVVPSDLNFNPIDVPNRPAPMM
jgi:hypothetical protein